MASVRGQPTGRNSVAAHSAFRDVDDQIAAGCEAYGAGRVSPERSRGQRVCDRRYVVGPARRVAREAPRAVSATAGDVKDALAQHADPNDAANLQRYFKTGPGEYGEGDVFIGVRVPATRGVAKAFVDLPLGELDSLLDSDVHEHRLAALIILTKQFARASKPTRLDVDGRAEIVDVYLAAVRRGRVNNWDLVDASAEHIIGSWLADEPRELLAVLAGSESLWERRVALLSTFAFIKRDDASTSLELAERLLPERTDLIQKALGWMLREIGWRVDRTVLTDFLETHAGSMGRTALSYATEHLHPAERARYRAMRPWPRRSDPTLLLVRESGHR